MALDPVTAIAGATDTIAAIINKFVPDRDQSARLANDIQVELIKQVGQSDSSQASTNTAEAANPSLMVSGWRPAVGWVCVASFAWIYLGQPIFSCAYSAITKQPAPAPAIDSNELMFLLSGMLGLGGLRTFEKIKGVTK